MAPLIASNDLTDRWGEFQATPLGLEFQASSSAASPKATCVDAG